MLCVCCCVGLAVVQQGLRTQCCSSDEESSAAPLFSFCFLAFQHFLQSLQFLLTSSLIRLYLLAFSTPLSPSLSVPCQCDPCVVLRQRLAEAAEKGNIYRSVRWGWALLALHTHSSSSITVTTAATHRQGHCYTHIYKHFSHSISTHKQVHLHIWSYSKVLNMQTHVNICTDLGKTAEKVSNTAAMLDVFCC